MRAKRDSLSRYKPYNKQTEFHAAGKTHRERLFMAGNQLGKTLAGGHEVAMHATGRYPEGWKGKRFPKANSGWAAGVTGEIHYVDAGYNKVGMPDPKNIS